MYNQLTLEQQERLDLLETLTTRLHTVIEEIQKFGYSVYTPGMSGPDNRGKLEAVLGDINALAIEMAKAHDIDTAEVAAHTYRRIRTIEQLRDRVQH